MKRNFATVYRVNSLAGYDPLVEERPEYLQLTERLHADFVHTLRKYGVTYIVLHRSAWSPVYSENPVYRPIETQSLLLHEPVRVYCQQRRPIYEGPGVRILAVDDPEPLAFCIDRPDLPLPLEETPAGIKVDASPLPQGGKVVVNYLWYPNIRVSADGRALVCDADRFGRIATEIPAATRTLTVGYRSAWLDGLGIGAGLLCVGLVLQIILSRIFLEPVNGNTDDPIARRHQSATPVHGSPGG